MIVNRDPIQMGNLHTLSSLLGYLVSQLPHHCKYRVAHLRHQFLLYIEPLHLALNSCSSKPQQGTSSFFIYRRTSLFSSFSQYIIYRVALHSLTRGGVLLEHTQDSSVILLIHIREHNKICGILHLSGLM